MHLGHVWRHQCDNVMLPELRVAGPGCQQQRLNVALRDACQLEGATPHVHQDPVAGLAGALRPAAWLGSDSPHLLSGTSATGSHKKESAAQASPLSPVRPYLVPISTHSAQAAMGRRGPHLCPPLPSAPIRPPPPRMHQYSHAGNAHEQTRPRAGPCMLLCCTGAMQRRKLNGPSMLRVEVGMTDWCWVIGGVHVTFTRLPNANQQSM